VKIRKGDTVMVIAGKDSGKKGKVRRVLPSENQIVADGINMIKRHTKPRGVARQAGIIEREAPVNISDVMLVCGKCNRPVRVGFRLLGDGKKTRICRSCHEVID
jgi:large subunit ribosomal protein L24